MSLPLRIAWSALRRPALYRYGHHPSQLAELYLPAGPGPYPVAVLLHGGNWQSRYGKLIMRPLCVDLVRRGWAAWNMEYRRLGRDGGGWPATFDDVSAGIDFLAELEDPRIDLERVAAVGHSAGGHLALWAGARPGLPAGAPGAEPGVALRQVVGLAPVCNLIHGGRSAVALVGGGIDEFPERWAQANPICRVPLSMPVFLAHYRDDATVSVHHSREYAAAVRATGGDVTLVEIAVGGHQAPIDPSRAAWQAAVRWMTDGTSARSRDVIGPTDQAEA